MHAELKQNIIDMDNGLKFRFSVPRRIKVIRTAGNKIREKMIKGDVLIVDDNPDNLRLLSWLLSKNGYKVRPSPSG
ncbi:MAG: hypothetical protein KAQ93_07760, partial [Spirochaetales bacterium]|nr:hypothetical protein [Spirochaetales bacterium]